MPRGAFTHLEIPVEDLDRAQAFYSSLFGWPIQEFPGYEGYPMWRGPNGYSGGGLDRRNGRSVPVRNYVEVASIDELLVRVVELGGRVVEGRSPIDETSATAVVADPDGNEIGLYEGPTGEIDGRPQSAGDVVHVDIPVSDTGRAATFYSGLFGWELHEVPGFEGYPMWQGPDGNGGGLAPRSEAFTVPRSYVLVRSIEETLARVESLGGTVTRGREPIDDASWWAVLEDPDGNEIGLYETAETRAGVPEAASEGEISGGGAGRPTPR